MKPELGVCYYPEHWPEELWADDAARMRAVGLSWVRIGEFAWSRLEPTEGDFQWSWLERAVEILGKAGLKIVMGTPTATPPNWVLKKYPDMLAVDSLGNPRKFGSRRHYCFSHLGYRREAARMARDMTAQFANSTYIHAWQIDNEYGCHETTLSYSDAARVNFQDWLGQKYQSSDALNRAWGNVFWSMDYNEFSEVDVPNNTVTEPNPSHFLDFRRFTSDQVIAFNAAQVQAMRPNTNKPLIHNYMGRVTDFDHFSVAQDLEIASWDSYPLGFLEQVLKEETAEWKARFACQGDPDFQAFHHDLYRAVGRGCMWVMEQQPGPVNWAAYNPIPLDGMVKLWTMEAIAHGAEVVSYFRWRQAPFAQEQMHAGLLRPDSIPAQAYTECAEIYEEIQQLGDIAHQDADVAIVFDYPSQWAGEIQPQGQDFDYFRLVFEQYRALRKLGLSIDILPSNTTDFGARKLVLIPALMAWTPQIREAVANFNGAIIAGPRTGLKTPDHQIAVPLGPDFADTCTARVASLRPNTQISLQNGGKIIHWFEQLEGGNPCAYTSEGAIVMVKKDNHYYLGAWLDQEGYMRIFADIAQLQELDIEPMDEGVRQRKMGAKTLIINYNAHSVETKNTTIPAASYYLL